MGTAVIESFILAAAGCPACDNTLYLPPTGSFTVLTPCNLAIFAFAAANWDCFAPASTIIELLKLVNELEGINFSDFSENSVIIDII